jgi:hypothetical protein
MKTVKFTHACPVLRSWTTADGRSVDEQPCDSDVIVEYEAGRSPDDFFSVNDSEECDCGHVVPAVVATLWYQDDLADYASRFQEA